MIYEKKKRTGIKGRSYPIPSGQRAVGLTAPESPVSTCE